jgi:carboxymethylenebutenolidase
LVVNKRSIKINTDGGSMETLMVQPDGRGPFPAVVLLHHIGGVSESMQHMAYRIAEAGYACAVPNLYYRIGSIVVDPLSTDERIAAVRSIAANSLSSRAVFADIEAVLRFLDDDALVRDGKKGLVGYGWTGGLSLSVAARFPEVFAATAVVLGVGFTTTADDSPHLTFDRIQGEVYCAFCDPDPIIPPSVPRQLADLFQRCGVHAKVVVHRGVQHGYPFPDRAVYNSATADRDWDAIFAMFRRKIG